MALVGKWNGHKFQVSKKQFYSFGDLTIKGSSETEDKTKDKQKYVKRKNGKPTEVSITVVLNAEIAGKTITETVQDRVVSKQGGKMITRTVERTQKRYEALDVRQDAMQFIEEARKGKADYFYIGGKKLVPYKLMLVDATVKEVEIDAKKTWVRAEVQLSMKQCAKGGDSSGDSSGGSSGGKKKSKKKSTKSRGTKTPKTPEVDAVSGAAPSVKKPAKTAADKLKDAIKKATEQVRKIIGGGKKTSSQSKPTPKTTNPSSSSRRISGTTR